MDRLIHVLRKLSNQVRAHLADVLWIADALRESRMAPVSRRSQAILPGREIATVDRIRKHREIFVGQVSGAN
jgi:hypothetical protein